jgi:DNA modification methylase
VVFLAPINHILGLRVRLADMEQAGFGIKEVLLCKTPPLPWPQSGFQIAAVHLQRGYLGGITWGRLDESTALVTSPQVHVLRASVFAIPLADKSMQQIITSPPYYGLRKYAGGAEGDLGREKTIQEYIDHLMLAAKEWWRVLRDDGTVFLNIADTYHGSGRGGGKNGTNDMKLNPHCAGTPLRGQGRAKSLCAIPDRVKIALIEFGWIVRNDIIWEKPNSTPSSVMDRCTNSYEHIFVLTKQGDYLWNWEAGQEPSVTPWHPVGTGPKGDALLADGTHGARSRGPRLMPPIGGKKHQEVGNGTLVGNRVPFRETRNLRDIWRISTKPHKDPHTAMWPEELVERCISLGSRPGDTILDCCAGSGTAGLVARQQARNAVLMDISAEYCQLMKSRLATAAANGGSSEPSVVGQDGEKRASANDDTKIDSALCRTDATECDR